jgi:hypothetical protein
MINGHKAPLPSWRKFLVTISFPIFRVLLMVMGFWYFSVKGKKASRDVAPISVANHATAFDGFILDYLLQAAPIMRYESAENPGFENEKLM